MPNAAKTPVILSIQSDVVRGHVGNGAARFAFQRLGFDVWALPTVLLSNHPGHGKARGETTSAAGLRALLDGLDDHGWLGACAGIISGYLGSADHADVVADAVARVKAKNSKALFLCDPVFGDDGGAYARPGVAEAIARRLIPLADIVTPNRFELSSLTAMKIEDAKSAVAAVRALGRRETVVTSVPMDQKIGSIAVGADGAFGVSTPRLSGVPHGTGDLLSALYFARRLGGAPVRAALEHAAGALDHVIRASVASQADELRLVAAQEALLPGGSGLEAFPITA